MCDDKISEISRTYLEPVEARRQLARISKLLISSESQENNNDNTTAALTSIRLESCASLINVLMCYNGDISLKELNKRTGY